MSLTSSIVAPRTFSIFASKRAQAELLARLRDAAEPAQHQRAQRALVAAGGKGFAAVERLRQTGQADGAGREPFALAGFGKVGAFELEFVAQLAEQLLEQVFECDQPEQLAIFVDHECELEAAPAHLVEQFAERLARRHEVGLADQPLQARRRGLQAPRDQILGPQHAHDVVGIAAVDGNARVMAVGDFGDDAVDGGVEVEREDALAWRHDLGDPPRAERKHLVDQFALGRRHLAEPLAGDEQRLELALRERRGWAAPLQARKAAPTDGRSPRPRQAAAR